MIEKKADGTTGRRGLGRRLFWLSTLAVGALLLWSSLPGWGRAHRHHATRTPEELLDRMGRGTAWALRQVDATEEQQARIRAILDGLAPDLLKLETERRALLARLLDAFETDPVSREELARIRIAGLSLAEQALDRSVTALHQAADVLTPPQRKALAGAWRDGR